MDRTAAESRLGLNIPYEWWPTTPLLKEIEASGFSWVQVPSPPGSILGDPRACIRHAAAVGQVLATTGLRSVLHAPTDLRLGEPLADRVFEGTLSYAAECGAEQVVYHARSMPEGPGAGELLFRESSSLIRLTRTAERLGLTIAAENLAPVYPGPQSISAIPATVRSLVQRVGSEALSVCLDIGHANVIAGLRRTDLPGLIEPVLSSVSLFHLHDNLGARWSDDGRPELDPLRLDLHLAPGRGSLDWGEVAPLLRRHEAPILLEVHPPHRPAPGVLQGLTLAALEPRRARSGDELPA